MGLELVSATFASGLELSTAQGCAAQGGILALALHSDHGERGCSRPREERTALAVQLLRDAGFARPIQRCFPQYSEGCDQGQLWAAEPAAHHNEATRKAQEVPQAPQPPLVCGQEALARLAAGRQPLDLLALLHPKVVVEMHSCIHHRTLVPEEWSWLGVVPLWQAWAPDARLAPGVKSAAPSEQLWQHQGYVVAVREGARPSQVADAQLGSAQVDQAPYGSHLSLLWSRHIPRCLEKHRFRLEDCCMSLCSLAAPPLLLD
mmetsp:Transcript_66651/g.124426  ORF Transcript_66651/g.124426 Transcript_66651/m.124426 type:complete len:261 (-) Transcript_66651:1054-1836(-)